MGSKDAEYLDNLRARREEFDGLLKAMVRSTRGKAWLAARETEEESFRSPGADEPEWDAMPKVAKDFLASSLTDDASEYDGAGGEALPDDFDGVPVF